MKQRWWWILGAVGVGGALWWAGGSLGPRLTDKPRSFAFTSVTRGSIEKVVSATGTLEAVSSVSVLPQMSGRVEKVLATYNDHVKKGQLLVQLNTDMLKLQAKEQGSAVAKAQATYDLQLLDFQNKTKLATKSLVSGYDLKSSRATLDADAADLASAQAALAVIQTQINQYANITSPIDGIVLACNVAVGQSVVDGSSTNSSSVFTLAADLSKMDVLASVDELDIASVHQGQKVRFSVEARPGETFEGEVTEIRLVPLTSSNVVTYYVEVSADNQKEHLLPGMTAEVEFVEQSKQNVLVVPSAALRFQPSVLSAQDIQRKIFEAGLADLPADLRDKAKADFEASLASGKAATKGLQGLGGMMMGGPGGPPQGGGGPGGPPGVRKAPTKAATDQPPGPPARKALWSWDNGQWSVTLVSPGVSNGTLTEVDGAGDLEGRRVVLKEKVD